MPESEEKGLTTYTFDGTVELPKPATVAPTEQGTLQGIVFTMDPEQREWFLEKITLWFDGRDEVILIDSGTTDKSGDGYIILEWDCIEPDPLFVSILKNEDLIFDYTVYTRYI